MRTATRHHLERHRPWSALVAWTLLALLFVRVAAVEAHGYVAESTPADGAVLDTGPEEVRVVFTEPIETGVSVLRLVDASGTEIAGTKEAVSDRELRLVFTQPLAPGEYRIEWQTLAKDGHVTEGTIDFTVRGEASGQSGEAGGAGDPGQTGGADQAGADGQAQEPPVSRAAEEPPSVGTVDDGNAPAGRPMLPVVIAAGLIVVAAAGWWYRRWRS